MVGAAWGVPGLARTGALPCHHTRGVQANAIWLFAQLLRLVCCLPIVMLVVWGSAASKKLKPELVGVAISTLWTSFFFFLYGMLLWASRYWRMANSSRLPSLAQVSLVLAFICFAVFEWYAIITYVMRCHAVGSCRCRCTC